MPTDDASPPPTLQALRTERGWPLEPAAVAVGGYEPMEGLPYALSRCAPSAFRAAAAREKGGQQCPAIAAKYAPR
jgi:hypothetical protein